MRMHFRWLCLISVLFIGHAQADVLGLFVADSRGDKVDPSQFQPGRRTRLVFSNTRFETDGTSLELPLGGKRVWISHRHLQAVPLDDTFAVRAAPESAAKSYGRLRDATLVDDIVFTGRTGPGTSKAWLEVLFLGERRWVDARALRQPVPGLSAAAPPRAPAPSQANPESTASKSVARPKTCVSTQAEAMNSPPHRALLQRARLFRRWSSSVGAWVDVSPEGQGEFYHPLTGKKTPLHVSICVTAAGHAYVALRGGEFSQNVQFTDQQSLSEVMVTDPSSGSQYSFR